MTLSHGVESVGGTAGVAVPVSVLVEVGDVVTVTLAVAEIGAVVSIGGVAATSAGMINVCPA